MVLKMSLYICLSKSVWTLLYFRPSIKSANLTGYSLKDMRSSMKHALYQDFFSHTCWFFLRKCISNHETKASKFQSDPSPNCFTIDVWNINCWRQQFISYFLIVFLYLIFHEFCSVLIMWYFENRFVLGTIFI